MKTNIKNFFYSKEWFRNLFTNDYFIKVDGNWMAQDKDFLEFLSFKKGQKIEDVRNPRIHNLIYCQNKECNSIVNFIGSFVRAHVAKYELVWDFKCSCCETTQHYIPDMAMIECDAHGQAL